MAPGASDEAWQHCGNIHPVHGQVEKPPNLRALDLRKLIYGRRLRLRALWTEWSVEVRVLSGALGKALLRHAGPFLFSKPHVRLKL